MRLSLAIRPRLKNCAILNWLPWPHRSLCSKSYAQLSSGVFAGTKAGYVVSSQRLAKYEVVGINAGHDDKDINDFTLALVRDPSFPNRANEIAVECGHSLYQPVLDRYIAGEQVSSSEV